MKVFFVVIVLATLSSLTACHDSFESPIAVRPPDEQLAWVSHIYVGGRQCDPSDNYVPPDVKTVLGSVGVNVFDTTIEFYAVCAACTCPAYAAMHYALIQKADLAKARQVGFEQHDPPRQSSEWGGLTSRAN